jgi:hypothetical protein
MKGPFTLLPRPPANRGGNIDPFELEKWFTRIWMILSGLPGLSWGLIDKSGSKLSDIEERPHSMLQKVLGVDVTDTGNSIENSDLVKHVSDTQALGWETARHDAANSLAMISMQKTYNGPRGDNQALNWMA